MKKRIFVVLTIILVLAVSIAEAKKPGDWIPPGHRGEGNAVAYQGQTQGQIQGQSQGMINDWSQSIGQSNYQGISITSPDSITIKAPVKWHSDEISPRDPATYEGPWKHGWNTSILPWMNKEKEAWTLEDVKEFTQAKVNVISGIYKTGSRPNQVSFKKPDKLDGIQYAGTIRLSCGTPECSPESLHRATVETAFEKGISYLHDVGFGATPAKVGGDWSLRLGGGGGGVTGDGGISGGGGIGGGQYWVAPGYMPWVIFDCWSYFKEGN